MSLYRKHQSLKKFVEWANVARFSFPVVMTMKVSGCDVVTDTTCHGWLLVIASAAVSVIGWWAHKRVSASLTSFVASVNASKALHAQYRHDARVGRHHDMIAGLRSEQTAALMIAAAAAKQGQALWAGYFYGRAKVAESRLRQHKH
ncbi:MAG: hypothetical protein WCF85_20095 [Rhodospirillaceae bacterium]